MAKLRSYVKTYPDFNTFATYVRMSQLQQKSLEPVYSSSSSIHDFIKKITTEYDCYLCKGWLSNMVNAFIPNIFGTSWIIKCDLQHVIHVHKLAKQPRDAFFFTASGGAALKEAMDSHCL